jgi:hypothetical protein
MIQASNFGNINAILQQPQKKKSSSVTSGPLSGQRTEPSLPIHLPEMFHKELP